MSVPAIQSQPDSASGPRALFGLPNFRLLWVGEAISLVGDQFYLIALPWLVLQLTGDALAMGTVLALAAIPRALFMLVGGAVTDRFSPRTVMLLSNLSRMVLVSLLAGLVLGNLVQLWMIYILALAFGLMDAFFYPAQSAIIPRVAGKKQLQPANAIMQGTMQLSLFAGPVLAGLLIAILGQRSTGSVQDLAGIGLAFIIDALTFLVSALTLWRIDDRQNKNEAGPPKADDSLLSSIGQGLRVAWHDIVLRALFILIAISNLLVNGPLFAGIPVLADTRFPEGAAAYGIIMSAFGGGSLLGTVLAGVLPRPPAGILGVILGTFWSGLGFGVMAIGLANTTPIAAAASLAMGASQGYAVILFITWLQRRTDEAMLGRMMSLLMFSSVGVQPLSYIVTGALVGLNAQALFVVAGGTMALTVFLFMLNPTVRAMEETAVTVTDGQPLTTEL